ncbi:Protein SUPPRESSOR OF NPR1-1 CONSTITUTIVE 4 [Dichanthelium oligosanthes]|uniref:Protein SUPPRESSOR OF NPR1-1 CONSTITUTIVE 4 n=1 Tax=Dichanthelium oligosanthes TaxID=888268 RepID=A0A1E5VAF9_9POAL|nr:Protein SUPPRESSOR OF NPR1-1 CONSTITUTIVE 4 [Dichanthelium oligosanthes]
MACCCDFKVLCFYLVLAHAAGASSAAVNISIYWGQNAKEGSLATTCGTGRYVFVIMSFLCEFGSGRTPKLNFADHCNTTAGACAGLRDDINSCQSNGVKVLLSIGGLLGNYSLSSTSDAQGVATYLWDAFLGGNAVSRPFGDAVLDGIDFNLISHSSTYYYDDLARKLTSLYQGGKGGRTYLLTAAPQCPYPDASLCPALRTGLFDHVWVQFYNNPVCQYDYETGDVNNLKRTWDQWVRPLPSASVFLGLLLGQGGYGAVFRGSLPDGREIAVKMLKDTEGDGEEFMNEVASISRTSHVNIVTLLGFCLQGSKRALIYEYMPNGSLERYAFGNNSAEDQNLRWDKLFDIVVGIARGLDYLYNGCNIPIVHFDIKPQNILLDQSFCPKISDFGLAKLCRQKQSKISIVGARGTIGYIAPEVFNRSYGAVSYKSDVYSYGMVVLEMVGTRKQINVNTDSSSKYFPQWLHDNLDQFCGTITCEINSNATELVRKMIIVGLCCIQFRPGDRPSMSEVLEMLESDPVDLQLPPKAFWTG